MAIFVSGTGTNVGKTFFSILCLAKYMKKMKLQYWKPIETGPIEESDFENVCTSIGLSGTNIIPPFTRYQFPAAPHYSARLEKKNLDIVAFADLWQKNISKKNLIEGAGGLFVPITDDLLYVDFIKKFNIPVILVIPSGLGTINHTLLSIEALQNRNIPCLGFYMIGSWDELAKDNRAMIERFGNVNFLGQTEIPYKRLNGQELVSYAEEHFDREGGVSKILS